MKKSGRDMSPIASAGIAIAHGWRMANQLVSDLMSDTLAVCTPNTSIEDVARLMVQHRCGEIPVVDNVDRGLPVGVVTDRDIVCRLVAKGKNPLTVRAEECMSQPAITVRADEPLADAIATMERHQIRRVPVVDGSGVCVGVLSQADVAWKAEHAVGELVREVSRDTGAEAR